jgi:hypothetical protein
MPTLSRRHLVATAVALPALAVLVEYGVDCRSGADVVAGARVYRRLVERQPIQRDNLFPGQFVGGTPAHRFNIAQHRQAATV